VARADLARAEVMVDYTRIVAPFDGIVTERNFDRGAFIRAAAEGAGEPLVKLARTDHVRVVVRIADPDVPFVHPGQPAVVKIDALGGETFAGTVSRVSGHQDRRTRTMRAEIDLPNAANLLAGGMYGAVSITVPAPAENLSLPEECLVGRTHNGRGKVYVLSEGRLHLRTVGVGRRGEGRVEVLAGLAPTDRVLADGPDDTAAPLDGLRAIARSDRPVLPGPAGPALSLRTER
jgi:RND family efflux transporter MFP subunit